MIETDHNAYTEETKEQRKRQMAAVSQCYAGDNARHNPHISLLNKMHVNFPFSLIIMRIHNIPIDGIFCI